MVGQETTGWGKRVMLGWVWRLRCLHRDSSGSLRLVPSRPCWYTDFMSVQSYGNPIPRSRM